MSKVQIYTTFTCPYCYRAKDLLTSKGVDFQEISVDGSSSMREEMVRLSGGYTVPQIFIEDKPIGGCDELYALHHQGKLDELLNIN